MTNAYVEYRPKSSDQTHGVTHHVVEVNGVEVRQFNTQLEAEKWACSQGTPQARQAHPGPLAKVRLQALNGLCE
jgi:hypothetical protein